MEIKVGDYVRMSWGIDKVSNIYERIDRNIVFDTTNGYQNYFTEIIKSSSNIIDLIEVGDYVNGKKVIKIWEEPFGEFAGQIFTILDGEETAPTIRTIKSIVTKEQFESMEYKLND